MITLILNCLTILLYLYMIIEIIKFSNELDKRNSPIIYLDTFYSKKYFNQLNEPVSWFNPWYKMEGYI